LRVLGGRIKRGREGSRLAVCKDREVREEVREAAGSDWGGQT
jgi:hypothetical protein